MTQWLTRDKSDIIVGIDYDKNEVWLYKGGIVTGSSDWGPTTSFWFDQGYLMGSQA